jgi:hypothetical protein
MRFHEIRRVRSQGAVWAIKSHTDLPLDQQPELRNLVLQNGAGSN